MADKLVVSKHGTKTKSFTDEELSQRQIEQQQVEEQAQLDALKPSHEEVEKAEFELKTINLLMELGVNI